MCDLAGHDTLSGFHALPLELQTDIFQYIYRPWHFQYTQEHDLLKAEHEDIKSAAIRLAADQKSTPRFSKLPSIGPLLVCKTFYRAGQPIFEASYTRHVHVVSRMIWEVVHWSYESLLAKATDLTIDENHFWSFRDHGILKKMVNLERVTMIFSRILPKSNARYRQMDDIQNEKSGSIPDSVDLEGSEHWKHLPAILDLSDAGVQRYWDDLVAEPPTNWRIMHSDSRVRLETVSQSLSTQLNLQTTWRGILNLPVVSDHPSDEFNIFLMMDFRYDFTGPLNPFPTGDRDPMLVRKRLAIWEPECNCMAHPG